jgi:hypothetical protein
MRREKPGAPAGLGYRVRRLVVGDGRASTLSSTSRATPGSPQDPRVQVREFLVVLAERAPVVKAHESGEDEPGYCLAHHCQHEEQERVRYSSLLCLSSISRPRI